MNLRSFPLICVGSFLFLLFFAPATRAQSSLFTTYTTRDGLAANYVTSLAFESGSAAWIGTPLGATRVQDNYWVTYKTAHGLGNDFIYASAVGARDRVYFATFGGGLSLFDGAARRTYNTSNSGIPSNYVTAVALDKQNRVWVGTFGAGVARLDGDLWTRYALANNYINALALDANGNPWIATNGGAYYFDGADFAPLTQANGLASNRVQAIAVAPDRRVWFGTDNGVSVRDLSGRFTTYREANGLAHNVGRALAFDAQNRVWVGTLRGLSVFDGKTWKTYQTADGLADDTVTALATDAHGNVWAGTPRGLSVASAELEHVTTLPVVFVHGWHSAESDLIDDSEFRHLKRYMERDGFRVFYATGVSPNQTLFQNAERIREAIAEAKAKTGAPQVDLLAFSMGGLNTRAFLESSLYEHDVRRVIILGTPQAGVRMWLPLLAREMEDRPNEPSPIELTEEYATLFNQTHQPRASVPYDLLVGDARAQGNLELLKILPPGDGLIEQASAHALTAPRVRRVLNSDVHAWEPTQLPINLTAYLYPEQTYTRYLRNALRDPDIRPIGPVAPSVEPLAHRNITPMNVSTLEAGETLTQTLIIDSNRAARFFARWNAGEVDVQLRAPDGTRYTGDNIRDTHFIKAEITPFVGYNIRPAPAGVWSLIATRTDKGTQPLKLTTYADLDADLRLDASPDRPRYPLGATVTLNATLSNRLAIADVRAKILWLGNGVTPRDPPLEVKLTPTREAGNYQIPIVGLTRGGYYLVRVSAGTPTFGRERQFLFAMSPDTARFAGAPSWNPVGAAGNYAGIVVEAQVETKRAGAFALAAHVKSAAGETVVAQTAPVKLESGTHKTYILIPGRDLRARGIDGPYTIDLVLMDANWAAIQVDEQSNAIVTDAFKASDFGE